MQRFWDEFLLPVARGCEAKVVCEIGSEFGGLTRRLLDYCVEEGAVAHVIDPHPQFDVEAWREEYGDALVFHRQLSLEVLGTIPAPDLVLIDGDHNWYTVVNELRLLEGQVEGEDRSLPVIALHDIGWPYGRRDLYYDPGTIPPKHRQKCKQRGIRPDDESLTDEGINGHLCNAAHEGGEHNGVMTAVEDSTLFLDGAPASAHLPAWLVHGLVLLWELGIRGAGRPQVGRARGAKYSGLHLWDHFGRRVGGRLRRRRRAFRRFRRPWVRRMQKAPRRMQRRVYRMTGMIGRYLR